MEMTPPVGTLRFRKKGDGFTLAFPTWNWVHSGGKWLNDFHTEFQVEFDAKYLTPEEWTTEDD